MIRFAAVAMTLLIFAGGRSEAAPRQLTIAEAEHLITAELQQDYPGALKLPGFAIEHYVDTSLPNFVVFQVNWRGNPDGGMVVENFDINMRTADLWIATMCEEKLGPKTRKVQWELRRKMRLSRSEYRALRVPGPFCE